MSWGAAALGGALALIGAAALPPLSAYVGHYAHDEVGGYTFLAHPVVKKAVERAAPNRMLAWQALQPEVTSPIEASGSVIMTQSCEAHNCPGQTWAVVIDAGSETAAICYFDEDLTGEARWFVDGQRVDVTPIRDYCPHKIADLPQAIAQTVAKPLESFDEK